MPEKHFYIVKYKGLSEVSTFAENKNEAISNVKKHWIDHGRNPIELEYAGLATEIYAEFEYNDDEW